MKIAVYPGSFDPITLGHLNIVKRASRIFDKVYVSVMVNSAKNPLFSMEERMEYIRRTTERFGNVVADCSDKLLVSYARDVGATVIVKGLRAVSDFELEYQIALANKKLAPEIETVFLTSSEKYSYLSSSIVKEMAIYHADLTPFVPREIIEDFQKKVDERRIH